MARTTINEISLRKKFATAASAPNRVAFMRNAALARVTAAREEMLDKFDEDEVTKELQQDAATPGSTLISKGNLVSFIGFEGGDGATEAANLREYLRTHTVLKDKPPVIVDKKNRIDFNFTVSVPSKTEIYEAFPSPKQNGAPYSSRGWVEIIEKGIGNAAKYIFWWEGFKSGSRSGTGLQTKGTATNPGSFTPKPTYISGLIERFLARFK